MELISYQKQFYGSQILVHNNIYRNSRPTSSTTEPLHQQNSV